MRIAAEAQHACASTLTVVCCSCFGVGGVSAESRDLHRRAYGLTKAGALVLKPSTGRYDGRLGNYQYYYLRIPDICWNIPQNAVLVVKLLSCRRSISVDNYART